MTNSKVELVDLIWVFIMTYHLYKYTKHFINLKKVIDCTTKLTTLILINFKQWRERRHSLIACFKRIHRSNSPFLIKFILQNVLNWFFVWKIQFFGIHHIRANSIEFGPKLSKIRPKATILRPTFGQIHLICSVCTQ